MTNDKPTVTRSIRFAFRWPIEQTGPDEVEVKVPIGNGPPMISSDFAHFHRLSDGELDAAENAVLRAIAIIE